MVETETKIRVYWSERKYRINNSKNEGIIWEVKKLLFYQYYNIFKCCISVYSLNLFGLLLLIRGFKCFNLIN